MPQPFDAQRRSPSTGNILPLPVREERAGQNAFAQDVFPYKPASPLKNDVRQNLLRNHSQEISQIKADRVIANAPIKPTAASPPAASKATACHAISASKANCSTAVSCLRNADLHKMSPS